MPLEFLERGKQCGMTIELAEDGLVSNAGDAFPELVWDSGKAGLQKVQDVFADG